MSLKDRWALVTGASSGLGADFARQLAFQGANLILVARRREALEKLAADLRNQGGQVLVQACDLSQSEQRVQLAQSVERVDILVNNAGLGVYGHFADAPWEKVHQMLEVDVTALTHLTHLFLPQMRSRSWGRILQVASTASFQPCPSYAAYAATKSYVLNFSLALHYELRHSGITVTTLCPGVTATEFFQVSGQNLNYFQRSSIMTSPEVVRQGIEAMNARRPLVVAGRMNALLAWSTRFLPLSWLTALAGRLMKS